MGGRRAEIGNDGVSRAFVAAGPDEPEHVSVASLSFGCLSLSTAITGGRPTDTKKSYLASGTQFGDKLIVPR